MSGAQDPCYIVTATLLSINPNDVRAVEDGTAGADFVQSLLGFVPGADLALDAVAVGKAAANLVAEGEDYQNFKVDAVWAVTIFRSGGYQDPADSMSSFITAAPLLVSLSNEDVADVLAVAWGADSIDASAFTPSGLVVASNFWMLAYTK